MINEAERYHGVVLRQLIVKAGRPVQIGVANQTGRVDCFSIERAAFQIKYSTKRLSPWQFSFNADQLFEIASLARNYKSVWMILVCGVDGIVALKTQEFLLVTEARPGGICSIRISRSRNSMYRVSGNARELPFAKPHGIDELINEALGDEGSKVAAQ